MIFYIWKLKRILLKKYKKSKSPKINERYHHSLGVLKKALELKKTFKLPVNKKSLVTAALLHDYAKFVVEDEYQNVINKYHLPIHLSDYNPKIWHSILGPYIVQEELGISDNEVLDAIKYHTLGSLKMSLLSEIIYLADYTDETREDDYYQEAIKLSRVNFYKAIAYKIKQKIEQQPLTVTEELTKMYEKYRSLDGSNYYNHKNN
ncbi:MAG: bis(5'-nucleosyl)-tetraphosphatase (symmetrical) YqeK [Bacilli bacterium]|nr:bis(5'-nucleosyl)-tetraphosphatase (symmetrical) YqeK [Bacilli bacterium]